MSKVAKEMRVIAEVSGFRETESIGLGTSFTNDLNGLKGDMLWIRYKDGHFSYTNGDTSNSGTGKGVAALARVLIERLRGLR